MSCSVFAILNNKVEVSPAPGALFEALGSPTLLCVLGSRMFFNLKEAADRGVNVGTNWSSHSHTTMIFEDPGLEKGEQQYVFLH